MRLVIVESPFAPQTPLPDVACNLGAPCLKCRIEDIRAAELERNSRYLSAALADCLRRGEAPFASHGLYTRPGVLDDGKPEERAHGILAGFAWRYVAATTIFYVDLGWSDGMQRGLQHVHEIGATCELRRLGGEWADAARR